MGESRTVVAELVGVVNVDGGYALDIGHQPLITADEYTVVAPPYIDETFTLWRDRALTSTAASGD